MKRLVISIMIVLFVGGSMIMKESNAADVANCEVKTMCTVACGAGYVKCTGKKCKKGKDYVTCDGNRTDCCGGAIQ